MQKIDLGRVVKENIHEYEKNQKHKIFLLSHGLLQTQLLIKIIRVHISEHTKYLLKFLFPRISVYLFASYRYSEN